MAAINLTIEIPVRVPRLSIWARFKKAVLECVEESPLIQLLCCVDGNELQLNRVDRFTRQCVREEMRTHLGYGKGEDCVTAAMDETLLHSGYDLGNGGHIRRENEGVTRTYAEWDAYFAAIQVNPMVLLPTVERVKVVPKFAAACALHLRAKLGALNSSEANVLLAQRKYLEICRKHGVRDGDTVAHQQHVLNAFFGEGVLDEVGGIRRKLPRWVLALEGNPSSSVSSTPC